jgi:predicted DNA-binding transcriptional regulator AlpA
MAFKLTPPVFRREVERRLLDVRGVATLIGTPHRQAVWKKVAAGKLPPPIVRHERSYALWDKDEIESFTPDTKEKP